MITSKPGTTCDGSGAAVLWEQAVAQSGVPQYLGSPDDLKLLLMKAVNRKTPHHGYRVSDQATDSRFRGAGTSAQDSSRGSKAASLRCITTGAMWVCSTSSWRGLRWGSLLPTTHGRSCQ